MNQENKPDLLFVLSVDTEEEWDWSGDFPQKDFSVSNTVKIPALQAFFQSLGIRPTYFTDYAVVSDPDSVKRIKPFVDQQQCEIGAHLHPWSTPPYFGYSGERESHVVNLPAEQVEAKLDELLTIIQAQFSTTAKSFRTGRWGINADVLELLVKKGLSIDSSMYPFFKNEYFDCENTCLTPYWPDFDKPVNKGQQRSVMEIPVTVGFNHANYKLMFKLYKFLHLPGLEQCRMVGLAWHTRLMRKLYLSPEVTSGNDMKPLVDFAIDNQHPILHMYMHSSSLIDGATGLMPGEDTFSSICNNIQQVVEYARTRAHLKFCTISEAATLIENRNGISGRAA